MGSWSTALLRLGAKAQLGERRDLLVGRIEPALELGDLALERGDELPVHDRLGAPRRVLVEQPLLLVGEASRPGTPAPEAGKELATVQLLVGRRRHDNKHTRRRSLCPVPSEVLAWAYVITERLRLGSAQPAPDAPPHRRSATVRRAGGTSATAP